MRKALVLLVAVASVAFIAPPASAGMGGPPPEILDVYWEDLPVQVGDPDCHVDCDWERLVVVARDPNSSISEVIVHFGGSVAFAHTWCVQGKEIGKPATLRIPATYTEPGTYLVEVEVVSTPRCNWRAPQQSTVIAFETEVLA